MSVYLFICFSTVAAGQNNLTTDKKRCCFGLKVKFEERNMVAYKSILFRCKSIDTSKIIMRKKVFYS